MNLGPAHSAAGDTARLTPAVTTLFGAAPVSLSTLGGGRNSRVYRIDSGSPGHYVAKIYAPRGVDGRDRRGSEFAALRFLWGHGLRRIPEPIATFPEEGLSILGLVDGLPLASCDVSEKQVAELVTFLSRIDGLKGSEGSEFLSRASEAHFSFQAITKSIEARLSRLRRESDEGIGEGAAAGELRAFLSEELIPALEKITFGGAARLRTRGLDVDAELPRHARTLSPSDIGFHNTLQRPDGSLVFLDFEHFGWDDPAKIACDFLLHPAMDLPQSIHRYYLRNIVDAMPKAAGLDWRIPLLFPVFALKWCTILLNEFVSEHESRRNYAMRRTGRRESVLAEQLNKARGMLRLARKAHERPLQID